MCRGGSGSSLLLCSSQSSKGGAMPVCGFRVATLWVSPRVDRLSALPPRNHARGNVRGNRALDHLAVTSNFKGLSRIPSTLGPDQLSGRECHLKSLCRTVNSRTAQNKQVVPDSILGAKAVDPTRIGFGAVAEGRIVVPAPWRQTEPESVSRRHRGRPNQFPAPRRWTGSWSGHHCGSPPPTYFPRQFPAKGRSEPCRHQAARNHPRAAPPEAPVHPCCAATG